MKHTSSRGPCLSRRKATNSASLLSPKKPAAPSNSDMMLRIYPCFLSGLVKFFVFTLLFFVSLLISSLDVGNGGALYTLGMTVSDQVGEGHCSVCACVREGGCQQCMQESDWHFSDTPHGSDWLYWISNGGFLQIKLEPLGGATDSGLLDSWPVSYSTVRSLCQF